VGSLFQRQAASRLGCPSVIRLFVSLAIVLNPAQPPITGRLVVPVQTPSATKTGLRNYNIFPKGAASNVLGARPAQRPSSASLCLEACRRSIQNPLPRASVARYLLTEPCGSSVSVLFAPNRRGSARGPREIKSVRVARRSYFGVRLVGMPFSQLQRIGPCTSAPFAMPI